MNFFSKTPSHPNRQDETRQAIINFQKLIGKRLVSVSSFIGVNCVAITIFALRRGTYPAMLLGLISANSSILAYDARKIGKNMIRISSNEKNFKNLEWLCSDEYESMNANDQEKFRKSASDYAEEVTEGTVYANALTPRWLGKYSG